MRAPGFGALFAPGTRRAVARCMAFKRILCPIDFSSSSRLAFDMAIQLARESDGSLVVAYVWEPAPWLSGEYALVGSVVQEMVASSENELRKWCDQARERGIKQVESRFLTGVAWDRVVAAAQEDRAVDLIVMGTRGRTGIKHVLLGSVAEKTLRHAACPVLVVRARESA